MQLLLAELKRIEGQQQQLKTAAAENKVLIVHPIEGVILDEEDDDYAEVKEVKPDPDMFVPSGKVYNNMNWNHHSILPSASFHCVNVLANHTCCNAALNWCVK